MKTSFLDKIYAVYKNDHEIASGTAYECAEKLGVKPNTIYFHSTKTAKKRLAQRKDPENAITSVLIDE